MTNRSRHPGSCLLFLLFILSSISTSKLSARPVPLQAWRSAWRESTAAGVYAYRKGAYVHVGNESLERVFRVSDDVLRTVELVNKVSGESPQSQDEPEFSLKVTGAVAGELGTPDFKLVNIEVSEIPNGGLRVVFDLEYRRNAELKLKEVEEAYAHRRYQRKWLEVNWQGEGDVTVERIDVEEILFGWWYVAAPSHYGYGQPVFVGDMYLGLEYPGAETGIAGYTYLRHYPGRSAKEGLKSKTAIWGVAKTPAEVEEAFFDDYLATLRPQLPHPFVRFDLLSARPIQKAIAAVQTVESQVQGAGLHLDSFCMCDDGWQDMTTVWRPDPIPFPNGFGPLAQALKSYGSHLGLWLAPDGFTLDTRWGALRGLEVSHVGQRGSNGFYCMAGRNYSTSLKEALRSYILHDGVNNLWFDYNEFACNVPTHRHPIGRAGRDAEIDAYIDLLKYVKSLSREVHVEITTGMWLSPWWTLYADWVWLGGSDMGQARSIPALNPQESETTYRDSILYDDFRIHQYVFPFSAIKAHGFWEEKGTPFSSFKNDCMMVVGRGLSDLEIEDSPDNLDAKRYAFLGRVIRWDKNNWSILSHTRMILGDPGKGEVYGYTHAGKGAALVVLRNPSLTSRLMGLPFKTIGISPGVVKAGSVFEIYPTYSPMDIGEPPHRSLSVQILGAQTKVIAIVWDRSLINRLKF